MLLSDLLLCQALFRRTCIYFFLFLSLFLYSFSVDFCFLDSLLWVLMDLSGNGRTEPLHYVAELHPPCYLCEHYFSQLILTGIYYHFSV